jgi:hypothetical protein
MKKLVVSFATALFFKLAVAPIFTQTPIGSSGSLDGWLYDLNVLATVTFFVTIPMITYKLLKSKKVS